MDSLERRRTIITKVIRNGTHADDFQDWPGTTPAERIAEEARPHLKASSISSVEEVRDCSKKRLTFARTVRKKTIEKYDVEFCGWGSKARILTRRTTTKMPRATKGRSTK